ncbi:MAG: NfeD family protein [Ilumatobacteraceae bacterium]
MDLPEALVRRLAIALLAAPLVGGAGLSLLSGTAVAATVDTTVPADAGDDVATTDSLAPVDVFQVSGLFDEVMVDAVAAAVHRAEDNGSQALILQLNTGGAVASDEDMASLIETVRDADVAIGIWVGPSTSARAYGTPAQLFGVADVTAMVAGSRMGYTGEPLVDGVDLGDGAAALVDGSASFAEARDLGVLRLDTTDEGVPTVRSMVLALDGVELADGTVLDTVTQELADDGTTQNVSTLVRFSGLGLVDEMFHTVASSPIAYLFFVIGACLLIFEFFTAGVGVAGLVGAVLLVLGTYGLAELPARAGAVVALVLSLLAFSIDVQVGVPRFWTGAGLVLFIPSSFFLYSSLPGTSLRIGWIPLAVGIVGVMLTFFVGMPSMTRTRFATPTIGREWMVGADGTAIGAIDPEGVAEVNGARWRARTNRATPIAAGSALRVASIDGVTLEVEPLEGAARDYRERRPKAPDGAAAGDA